MSLPNVNPTSVDSEESDSDVQCYDHRKRVKKTKNLVKQDNTDKISCTKAASGRLQNQKRKRIDGHSKKGGKDSDSKKAKLSLLKKSEKKTQYAKLAEVFGDSESLNETNDFSGSFTPYRRAAQKVAENSEAFKERLQNKKQKKKKASATEVVECEDEKRNSSNNKHNSNDKGDTSNDKGDNSKDKEESTLNSSVENKQKMCRVCWVSVNAEKLRDHLKECLQNRYANKKEIRSEASDVKSAPIGSTIILCQICQEDMSSLKVEARIEHVNGCMDGKRKARTDGVMTSDHSTEDSTDRCPSCQKDLKTLTHQRRLQHINHCLDKVGEEKIREQAREYEERNALEEARNKVLDCPICGQPLKTSAARKTHLKRCASKYDISTQTLMQQVRDQEEEYNLKLAAGILPEPSRRQAITKRKRPGTKTNAKVHKGMPRSLLEEQTQLALALSSSLREDRERENNTAQTSMESVLQPEQRNNLNAFSILMSPKKKEPAPKRRRKKQRDTVPDLLLLSEDEMAKRMAERISEVVLTKLGNEDMQEMPPLKASRLSGYGNSTELWTKTGLVDVDSKMDKETFYVKELTPPIEMCKTSAGSKMKRLSSIPGRGSTSQERKDCLTKIHSSSTLNETTIIASTQTAVLLAELEEDVNTTMQCQTLSGTNTTMQCQTPSGTRTSQNSTLQCQTLSGTNTTMPCQSPSGTRTSQKSTMQCQTLSGTRTSQKSDTNAVNLDATGFILEPESQEYPVSDHLQKLTDNLCSMVNNSMLSDITIKVKGGDLVHAHKFMLAARCPQLLQATVATGSVNFHDFSKDAILSVLRYLYAADKDIPHTVMFEVQAIAKRLKLNDLLLICEEIIEKNDLEEKSADVTCDKDLNEFLKEMWSSDEEEEEEEVSGAKSDTENDNKKDEIDELYEFVASQKSKNAEEDSEHESSTDSELNISEIRPVKKRLCIGVEEKLKENFQVVMDGSCLIKSLSQSNQEEVKLSESEILTKLDSSFDKPFSQGMVQEFDTSFNETHIEEDEDCSLQVDTEDKVEKETHVECGNREDKDETSNITISQTQNEIIYENIILSDNEDGGLIDNQGIKDSFSENDEDNEDILNSNVNAVDLSFSESDHEDVGIDLTVEDNDEVQNDDIRISHEENKQEKGMDPILPDSQGYDIDPSIPPGNLSIQTPVIGLSPAVGSTEVTPDIFGPTPKTHNKSSNFVQINNSKYAGSPVLGKKKMLRIKGTRLIKEKQDDDPREDLSKSDSGDEPSNVVCLDSDKDDNDDLLQNSSACETKGNLVLNSSAYESREDLPQNSCEESIDLSFEKDLYSSPKFVGKQVMISEDEVELSPKFNSPLHEASFHNSPIHDSPIHDSPLHGSPLHDSPLHGSLLHEVDIEYPKPYSPLNADIESPVLQERVVNSSRINEKKSPSYTFGKESPVFKLTSREKRKNSPEKDTSLNLNESTASSVSSPVFSNSLRNLNESHNTEKQRVLSKEFVDENQEQVISEGEGLTGAENDDQVEVGGSEDIGNDRNRIIFNVKKKCDQKKMFKFKKTKPLSHTVESRKSSEEESPEKGPNISIDLTAGESGSPKHPVDEVEDLGTANEDKVEDIATANVVEDLGTAGEQQLNEDDTYAFIGDDIWDDFDDMGCMDQFDLQSQPKSKANSQSKPSSQINVKDHNQSIYDPPTDMDESNFETPQSVRKEKNTRKNVMVTPLPPKRKSKNVKKKLLPPSPFTPMANYEEMVTPELKKACGRYGVKALPKKKMKEVLKNIYSETHQYETDSDIDIDSLDEVQGQKSNKKQLKPTQNRQKYDFDEKSVPSGNSSMDDEQDAERSQSDSAVMEETYLIRDSDSDEKDEKETSNKCSKETKRKKILEYIKKNESLYIKILHYEPLELDLFRDELNENGIRVGIDIIMETLDEQNIQFTMRNARKGKNMHKKKSKKGVSSSQAPSTNVEDQI